MGMKKHSYVESSSISSGFAEGGGGGGGSAKEPDIKISILLCTACQWQYLCAHAERVIRDASSLLQRGGGGSARLHPTWRICQRASRATAQHQGLPMVTWRPPPASAGAVQEVTSPLHNLSVLRADFCQRLDGQLHLA